jgi:WD40 repeat protein
MGRAISQKFSPDGRWLASIFSNGRFVLWDATSGQQQGTIEGVKDFSLSLDSQVVALSCGTHIETHRLATWEPGHSLRLANVELVALHPDGDRIAATVGNAVEIWSLKSAQREMRLPLTAKPSEMVAWRPDGELLAVACADHCIYVWDIARRRQRVALRGHDNAGINLVFSPDGSVLASHAWDGTTRLWDPLLGRELVRIDGLVRQFSRDGRRLAYDDGTRRVGIWRLAGNEERRTLAAFHTRQGTRVTTGVAINRAGNLMAASGGDGVFVWEIPAGRLLGRLPWGFTGSVQFDFQDRLVVPAGNTLRLASLAPTSADLDNLEGVTFGTFTEILANCLLSDDGRIALAKESPHTIAVFSLAEPDRPIARMKHNGVSHTASGLALSPDGRYAATMGYRGAGVKLWDTSSGRLIDDLWPETAGGSVAFSPDGQWLAATSNEELRVWAVADWRLTARIPRLGQGNANGPIAFSPDGRMLAVAMSRSGVQLIDPLNWNRLTNIEPNNRSYEVKAMAFTPGSGILAICYIDAVDIWDLSPVRERLKSIGLDW